MHTISNAEETTPSIRIVRVIPIARGLGTEVLTYFSSQNPGVGSLVTIPLRNKTANALVVSSEDASLTKTDIKKAGYAIKKITGVKKGSFFTPAFVRAAEIGARYFVSRTGTIIETLTPKTILNQYMKTNEGAREQSDETKNAPTRVSEQFLLQADEEERISAYKNLVRGEFVEKKSVFMCLPTVSDVVRIAPLLERGIESYTYVFHGKLPRKELLLRWRRAREETHPIVIIATGLFFSLPRFDIGAIVLERENTSAYKIKRRPFIDVRTFAEFFARESGAKLILGDLFLRTETLYRKEKGEFLEFAPLKFRSVSSVSQEIIDMKKGALGEKAFTLWSPELLALIKKTKAENERLFILTARRGLYPITLCSDCGKVVACPTCDTPLVLHRKISRTKEPSKENIFLCHRCGIRKESSDACLACKSWRLKTLGVGSERAHEDLKRIAPECIVLRFDKDTTGGERKIKETIEKFYASPSGILIGTEMALPYLRGVTTTAVLSLDSLFALPDFRIQERMFVLLLRLRSQTAETLLIQTRIAEAPLWNYVATGNLIGFYREEIENRKKFNYPPFSVLLKITWHGKKVLVAKGREMLETALASYKPQFFPTFISKRGERYSMNALIRIDRAGWTDDNLLTLLYGLPASFSINIGPETIL